MNPRLPIGLFVFATTFAACASPPTIHSSRAYGTSLLQQDPPPRRTGDEVVPAANAPWEVLLAGAGVSNDDFDAGGAQVAVGVGYYVSDHVQIVARQNISYNDAGPGDGAPEVWNGASRAGIDLHLPIGAFVPFVGATVGYVYGDSVDDQIMVGPEAGAKIYVQRDAFLMAAAEYQFFFEDEDSLDSAFDDGQLVYTLGIGMRF